MAREYCQKEGKPVILFIDEVDSLLGERNSEVGGGEDPFIRECEN